ncbi:hypothetical protein BT63DRAFT_423377 [Microthyrium microscopicum]|uniref:Uncharacterized protein n=1 Tax=Microthyrium microscopicum TaxID=703497 RepID=A0A6A6UJS5_9PEZI|nr:hypothetical protein BT63DRAFT_423377 [Microthyrium microscopicum]
MYAPRIPGLPATSQRKTNLTTEESPNLSKLFYNFNLDGYAYPKAPGHEWILVRRIGRTTIDPPKDKPEYALWVGMSPTFAAEHAYEQMVPGSGGNRRKFNIKPTGRGALEEKLREKPDEIVVLDHDPLAAKVVVGPFKKGGQLQYRKLANPTGPGGLCEALTVHASEVFFAPEYRDDTIRRQDGRPVVWNGKVKEILNQGRPDCPPTLSARQNAGRITLKDLDCRDSEEEEGVDDADEGFEHANEVTEEEIPQDRRSSAADSEYEGLENTEHEEESLHPDSEGFESREFETEEEPNNPVRQNSHGFRTPARRRTEVSASQALRRSGRHPKVARDAIQKASSSAGKRKSDRPTFRGRANRDTEMLEPVITTSSTRRGRGPGRLSGSKSDQRGSQHANQQSITSTMAEGEADATASNTQTDEGQELSIHISSEGPVINTPHWTATIVRSGTDADGKKPHFRITY